MKKYLLICILATAIAAPMALSAEEENKEERYIYATYFYCNTATQEQADELVKKNNVPVYDAAVADGTIKGWGWLSHHTGG
jgi:Ni/Co efflux regulator RcnB